MIQNISTNYRDKNQYIQSTKNDRRGKNRKNSVWDTSYLNLTIRDEKV